MRENRFQLGGVEPRCNTFRQQQDRLEDSEYAGFDTGWG
jgi:hypothetical protein